jgi:hypothetical protein
MKFIVIAYMFKDGKPRSDTWSFDDLDEARDFADWKAGKLKEKGFEYDVAIYERTDY